MIINTLEKLNNMPFNMPKLALEVFSEYWNFTCPQYSHTQNHGTINQKMLLNILFTLLWIEFY